MEVVDGKPTDVIVVLMDVSQTLNTLRKLLESQVQCSLEQFEFWLQDTLQVCFYDFILVALWLHGYF